MLLFHGMYKNATQQRKGIFTFARGGNEEHYSKISVKTTPSLYRKVSPSVLKISTATT